MKVAEETSNNTDLSAMKLRARGGGSGTQWSTVDDETSNQRLSKETGPTGPNHKADEEPRDLETKTQHRVSYKGRKGSQFRKGFNAGKSARRANLYEFG